MNKQLGYGLWVSESAPLVVHDFSIYNDFNNNQNNRG